MLRPQRWFGVFIPLFLTLATAEDGKREKPLPDIKEFLNGVKTSLLNNNEIARDYMYRVRVTDNDLGFKGTNEYEVYHFKMSCEDCYQGALMNAVEYQIYPFNTHTYERWMDGDGSPQAKKDAKPDSGMAVEINVGRFLGGRKNLTEEEERREAEKEIDEIFSVFDIRLVGKEELNGHPTIVIRFTPRKEARPKSSKAKFLKNMEGKAWIEENEHAIMKIDAQVIDNASFGVGPLAKIQKGARFIEEKRKINNEVWLPSKTEFNYKVKMLLIPSHNIREVEEYYNHRRFKVDTKIEYERPK